MDGCVDTWMDGWSDTHFVNSKIQLINNVRYFSTTETLSNSLSNHCPISPPPPSDHSTIHPVCKRYSSLLSLYPKLGTWKRLPLLSNPRSVERYSCLDRNRLLGSVSLCVCGSMWLENHFARTPFSDWLICACVFSYRPLLEKAGSTNVFSTTNLRTRCRKRWADNQNSEVHHDVVREI